MSHPVHLRSRTLPLCSERGMPVPTLSATTSTYSAEHRMCRVWNTLRPQAYTGFCQECPQPPSSAQDVQQLLLGSGYFAVPLQPPQQPPPETCPSSAVYPQAKLHERSPLWMG